MSRERGPLSAGTGVVGGWVGERRDRSVQNLRKNSSLYETLWRFAGEREVVGLTHPVRGQDLSVRPHVNLLCTIFDMINKTIIVNEIK